MNLRFINLLTHVTYRLHTLRHPGGRLGRIWGRGFWLVQVLSMMAGQDLVSTWKETIDTSWEFDLQLIHHINILPHQMIHTNTEPHVTFEPLSQKRGQWVLQVRLLVPLHLPLRAHVNFLGCLDHWKVYVADHKDFYQCGHRASSPHDDFTMQKWQFWNDVRRFHKAFFLHPASDWPNIVGNNTKSKLRGPQEDTIGDRKKSLWSFEEVEDRNPGHFARWEP